MSGRVGVDGQAFEGGRSLRERFPATFGGAPDAGMGVGGLVFGDDETREHDDGPWGRTSARGGGRYHPDDFGAGAALGTAAAGIAAGGSGEGGGAGRVPLGADGYSSSSTRGAPLAAGAGSAVALASVGMSGVPGGGVGVLWPPLCGCMA